MKTFPKFELRCPHCGELITKDQYDELRAEFTSRIQAFYNQISDRDEKIYEEYKTGINKRVLARNNNLSASRIDQILHRRERIGRRIERAKIKGGL